jgi:hypothetical protein
MCRKDRGDGTIGGAPDRKASIRIPETRSSSSVTNHLMRFSTHYRRSLYGPLGLGVARKKQAFRPIGRATQEPIGGKYRGHLGGSAGGKDITDEIIDGKRILSAWFVGRNWGSAE